MLGVILAANVVAILYCMEPKNEFYYEYKQQEQQQYIESYQVFINEMGNRGSAILQAFDAGDSSFIKRDVEKTEQAYKGLAKLKLDQEYNAGVDEYAKYTYGIFFCVMFAFVCLEYIYLSERRNHMIRILRTTKKGRIQMILSKWIVYLLAISLFTILQEVITLAVYAKTYTLGNLTSPIQSVSVFRDCPNEMLLYQGILLLMANRLLLAITVGSVIFFAGISLKSMGKMVVLPGLLLVCQYICALMIPIESSFDALCCLNFFHAWDARNCIGMYHNLNIGGVPIEKNIVLFVLNIVVIVCAIVFGTVIFSTRYHLEEQKGEYRVSKWIRHFFSLALHRKNMLVNELYRVFFQQKKWVLLVVFVVAVGVSWDYYIPKDIYQTPYEANYHAHIANMEGKITKQSDQYVERVEQELDLLHKQMEQALEQGDSFAYGQYEMEYRTRKEAFDRVNAQYTKVKNSSEKEKYMIDEMELDEIFHQYERDILLFLVTAVVLILLISGLFASESEVKLSTLIISTKNGRKKLFHTKLIASLLFVILLFVGGGLPGIRGYGSVVQVEYLKQRADLLYDPQIDSGLTLFAILAIVYVIRCLSLLMIATATMLLARKTKNEFVTSVFSCTIVTIISVVLFFLQQNLTLMVIQGLC